MCVVMHCPREEVEVGMGVEGQEWVERWRRETRRMVVRRRDQKERIHWELGASLEKPGFGQMEAFPVERGQVASYWNPLAACGPLGVLLHSCR